MKKQLLFTLLAVILCAVSQVSAQENIRVKCGSLTMNVMSANVRCYQTKDNIPVAFNAMPEEIANAQTANTALYFSDFDGINTTIAPQVTLYAVDNLSKTSFSLMDVVMRLTEMISNINSGDMQIESVNTAGAFLPYQVLPQVLAKLPAIISFDGGSGIRSITTFSTQLSANRSSSNLYYSWQGMSNDGKYYISAVFPLLSVSLDGKSVDSVDWEHYDGSDLQPSLAQLDYYVSSIVIE